MTKNKSLRRALVMSIISILVCSAMLVGATFAWFSDSVSTGVNKIIAGNLKVDIQDLNGKSLDGESGEATLFNTEGVLWEPGMMFVSAPFVVVNKGNLALQYTIDTLMNDVSETLVGNRLSEVIKFKVANYADVEIEDSVAGRADFWAGIEAGAMGGVLEAEGKSEALVVVLYWAPTANDNLYNVTADQIKPVSDEDTEEYSALETHFAIQVTAQQVSSESDSFGPGYDANSAFGKVHSTIVNGVDLLNSETDMGSYARLGELTKVGANHYVSHVILDAFGTKYDEELEDTRAVTIGDVYFDIAETLFGEVISQSESIYSIKVVIDGYDVESTDEEYNPWVSNGGELTQQDIVWGPCAKAMVAFLVAEGQEANMSTLKYILEEAPVTLMAGHTINVTMTTMDGIATTYTLDFSVAFADTESSANIHNALKNGVNGANEAFADQGIENITVSELQFVGDKYVADVTFTEDCTEIEDVFNGYIAIAQFLGELVRNLGQNGDAMAVTVGGFDLQTLFDKELKNITWVDLTMSLAEWGRASLLTPEEVAELEETYGDSIDGVVALADIMLTRLNGASLDVTFTDAEGNVLSYTLNFAVLGQLEGSLLDIYQNN